MNSPKSPKANVDMNSLNPQEQRIYRLYGRVPFARHLKERKYFDSGDYALSKAGRADSAVGSLHPVPQNIPHPHPSQRSPGPIVPGMPVPGSFSRSGSFSLGDSNRDGMRASPPAPSTLKMAGMRLGNLGGMQ